MKHLLTLDILLSQKLTIPQNTGWWQLARLIAHAGDGPYIFGALGLIYLLAWLRQDELLLRTDLTVMVIVFLAILVNTLLKFLVRRARPHLPGEFVTFQLDAYSFPSGHSTRMAALSIGTLFFYPDLGWILLILTFGVSFTRVAVGVHYLGDILAGLGLGAVVAWIGVLLS
jgi:membrane-associated phospholipid phosphatase